jgi:hypothetical protein
VLKKKIPRIVNLRATGGCEVHKVFTNRKLSTGAEEDLVKFMKAGSGVTNAAIVYATPYSDQWHPYWKLA